MVFAIRDFLFLTDSPGEAKPLPVAGCLPSGLSLLFPAAGLGSWWDSPSRSLSVHDIERTFYIMDLSYHSFPPKAIQLTKQAPGKSRGLSCFQDLLLFLPPAPPSAPKPRASLPGGPSIVSRFYLDNYLNIT